jgi:methylmalonyl-CoA mutase
MNTTEKLFSGFDPVNREQWKAKAIEDLKGAEFDKKLVWNTDDGFPVQPFYTAEDINENGWLKEQHSLLAQDKRDWVNYTQVPVDDVAIANALAVEMVSFGATGILFQLKGALNTDFEVLLKNLDATQLHLSYSTPLPSAAFVSEYLTFLSSKNITSANIRGFYVADVLEHWITEGIEPDFDEVNKVIDACNETPGFKALPVQSHAFVNAGANTTQEIAFTFNKLTDYVDILVSRGLKVEAVVNSLLLHMAIGGDYFFEIAKLRTVRILLKSILQQYSLDVPVDILSSNSFWSKSFYEPNINMLRNTTEAMSAVLGGCDALLTYPHDSSNGGTSTFSRRVALNVSNVIKEESYFDKVVDPAGGSYYIESLTGALLENALNLFKEIEKDGGFIQTFKAGIIQKKIGDIREKKEMEIALRQRIYVGTNKYPNPAEKAGARGRTSANNKDGLQLLVPQHATQSLDEIRYKTLKHLEETGHVPSVYLACFGNAATGKARAAFSAEFFAIAGFYILGEFLFKDSQMAAEGSAGSTADIVVICSSDSDYKTSSVMFATTFKSLSKDKLLVLAGYPESNAEQLKQAGVDAFIHAKSNAVEMLSDFQQKLFVNQKL